MPDITIQNYLSQVVNRFEDPLFGELKTLPLVHTTDGFNFRQVLERFTLKPIKDDVFGEDLLYLFYGKPAYTRNTNTFSNFYSDLPVTLIFNPDYDFQVYRIFPLDSGAFENQLFKNYFPEQLTLENFALTGNVNFREVIKKFQLYFYGDNNSYFRNQPRQNLNYDRLHFEIQTYYNLINSKETSVFDERFSTIEVQITNEIELSNESLLGIILPDQFMESEMIANSFKKLDKVSIMTYESFRFKPDYFASILLYLIGNFYKANGYLDL